mmetsp:Transcript_78162/g.176665  ORF Transcript_78162/g.176665 Transcript_78162/m.176665 type:complete len:225 (+) Transcript_78162:215-889(+)
MPCQPQPQLAKVSSAEPGRPVSLPASRRPALSVAGCPVEPATSSTPPCGDLPRQCPPWRQRSVHAASSWRQLHAADPSVPPRSRRRRRPSGRARPVPDSTRPESGQACRPRCPREPLSVASGTDQPRLFCRSAGLSTDRSSRSRLPGGLQPASATIRPVEVPYPPPLCGAPPDRCGPSACHLPPCMPWSQSSTCLACLLPCCPWLLGLSAVHHALPSAGCTCRL